MLITATISAIQRPHGGVGARKFAAAALLIFVVFAGLFATAQRASADTGIPVSGATGAMADPAAGVPPGSTAVPPPDAGNVAPEAPVELSQPAAQDAATAQAATADATADQPQQSNSIGTTRTDRSGEESVSQENDVSLVGAAANGASTSQTAGSEPPSGDEPPAGAGQQATTDQDASAAAAAAQPQQSNIVIIIRINSPGDDVISQTNVVSVVAVGANQASTTQNPATAVASAPRTTDPPQSPSQSPSGTAPAPATAPTPLTDGRSGQSSNLGQQPTQHPAAAVQQLRPQAVRALSILAFSASSNANLSAPNRAASATTTDSAPQPGGAAGRSGAFGPASVAALGPSGPSVNSGTPSGGEKAHLVARRIGAHSSSGGTLGAVPDVVADWLSRPRVAVGPQVSLDNGGGMSLGVLTLTALLVGLLGWAALTWAPLSRR